ncbi:MAG: hypothetical protein KUG77_18805 [Nannocystaceae bacterium]|nr:hypothetical protein [Nannocystaceae bacterium]
MIVWPLVSVLLLAPASPPAVAATAPTEAEQAAVTIQTRLSPEPSSVGDLLTYEVIVAFPRGITVNLPTQLDFSPLHLVRSEDSSPEVTGASLRKVFTLTLQHFETGEAVVPSFALTTVDASGAIETVTVPSKPFVVEALLANEVDPGRKGEDDPVSIAYPNERAEVGIYATLAGILLALIGWFIVRRFLRQPKVKPTPPPIPPHVVALSALDELEQGELMQEDDLVPFYLQLTEIAKGYLEGRFGIPSLDRTTEEIRRDLVRRGDSIAPLSADEVIEFLQRSDLVKFARFSPEDDEAGSALGEVRGMVERSTAPRKPEPPKADTEVSTTDPRVETPRNTDAPEAEVLASEPPDDENEEART